MATSPPFSSLADFIAAVDSLVPDPKGAYDESAFIAQALARLSDDVPAVESVDLSGAFFDDAFFDPDFFETEGTEYLVPGVFFPRWSVGFSDRFPIDAEALDSKGKPFASPEDWHGQIRTENRWANGALSTYLVFYEAPTSTSKARVRFRRPYSVTSTLVEVPPRFQMAVVFWAASLKCEALGSLYRSSVDPAGGSDIFDARMFAKDYDDKADAWRARYAELTDVGGDEPSFSTGRVKTSEGLVFRRGHYSGEHESP